MHLFFHICNESFISLYCSSVFGDLRREATLTLHIQFLLSTLAYGRNSRKASWLCYVGGTLWLMNLLVEYALWVKCGYIPYSFLLWSSYSYASEKEHSRQWQNNNTYGYIDAVSSFIFPRFPLLLLLTWSTVQNLFFQKIKN